MFVSRVNAPNKQSILACGTTFITPSEIRMKVLNASNNKINTKNEGKKFGSYARVHATRNANAMFTNSCNSNCTTNKDYIIPLKPKSPAIAFY